MKRIAIAATCILAALLILTIGCAQKDTGNHLAEYQQQATLAYQAGNYMEFQRLYQEIVELDPDDFSHRYNLACAYALNDDLQGTVRTLTFLLDQNYDLALLAESDADFDRFRDAPEFQPVMSRLKEKTSPLNNSRITFSIAERDLIPEGMAYDAGDDVFFLGSLHKGKIIRVDRNGKATDFTQPHQDGLIRVLGLRVDPQRRHLWAVCSYGFYVPHIPRELLGTSGVFKYDLRTGQFINKYMLPQEEGHYLNDIVIAPNGDVYATDWLVNGIYKIPADTDVMERYFDMPRQPNGIDISEDGKKLFIAGNGIGVMDLATKTYQELKRPASIYLSGDGLYFYKNSLIAVQAFKVSRFYLNEAQDEILRSEALEAFHPLFNLPTTGAVAGDEFHFIANSQLRAYNDGVIFPWDELDETTILRVGLE